MSEATAVQNPIIRYANQIGRQRVNRQEAAQWRGGESGLAEGVGQIRRYQRETPESFIASQVFEVTELFRFVYRPHLERQPQSVSQLENGTGRGDRFSGGN